MDRKDISAMSFDKIPVYKYPFYFLFRFSSLQATEKPRCFSQVAVHLLQIKVVFHRFLE